MGLVVLFLAAPLGSWCRAREVYWLCFAEVRHTLFQRLKFFLPCSLGAHLLLLVLRPGLPCWGCQRRSVFFSRKVLNFEVKPTHFEDHERNGATDIGLRSIVSSGRWSVCTSVAFPRMYSLILRALNTIVNISFSMGTQLSSDLRSLRDT